MYPQDPNQFAATPPTNPLPPVAPTPSSAPPTAPDNNRHPVHNPLSVMQPGEQMIAEIKRHPIGIFGVYIGVGILLTVAAVLAFVIAPMAITTMTRSQVNELGALIFVLFAAICAGFVWIFSTVYWGNSWVLTSDSLTQITQTSLFHKQSSQLSLGNLEDVTADQNGIVAHMLNYGVLRVETAGERSKFMFLYCPNPNYYAQQILTAREHFEQGRRGADLQRPYRDESSYAAYQPMQPAPVAPAAPGPNAYPPASYQPAPPSYPPAGGYQYPPAENPGGVNINTEG
ncbi:MAG TPA: hypothetical protein VG992_03340 [Candidatus Saccharimonadales bacterium]|nr:hypothetical protein [Candidatus Saccharimonadales bacterium]